MNLYFVLDNKNLLQNTEGEKRDQKMKRLQFPLLFFGDFWGKKLNTTNEARNMIFVLFLELQLLQSAPHPQAVCCLLPSFASRLLG